MPRPKSEITDGVHTGVRLSAAQHLTFLRLGSVRWLRQFLDDMEGKVDAYKLREDIERVKRMKETKS